MRLHTRVVKADFWRDPDLCDNLPFLGRIMYEGLWALADDSGCVIDSPSTFKRELFADEDSATVAKLTAWRDTLVRIGKLVPYEAAGKRCLWILNFHKHQRLDRPNPPSVNSVPLPPWITWCQGETRAKCRYIVSTLDSDMSATCQRQDSDASLSVQCTEPENLEPEPVERVGLSASAQAREETAATTGTVVPLAKRWRWSAPQLRPVLAAYQAAEPRRAPPNPLADVAMAAIDAGMAAELVTLIVGEVAARARLPSDNPDHVGDVTAYTDGILQSLQTTDPPVLTVEHYRQREAERRSRQEARARGQRDADRPNERPKFMNGFV